MYTVSLLLLAGWRGPQRASSNIVAKISRDRHVVNIYNTGRTVFESVGVSLLQMGSVQVNSFQIL